MRGSTRKRNSTWTAYWDVQEYDAETGQTERRQKSKGGFRTQKEAQAHLDGVVPAAKAGVYIEPSKAPLAGFLVSEWLPAISGTVRPLSAARYEKIVRGYIVPRDIGAVPLSALSGAHLTALYGAMADEGLSVATRRLTHAVLRRALNDAVRWGKLSRNPAGAADPPAASRTRAQAWSARELRMFLAHVQSHRLRALWRLAATTGMRRGELLGLTWRHVDLDASRLRVEQQLLPTVGGCTFGPPKSKRSERTVSLDPVTIAALRHHRETQQLERALAGVAYEDQDMVFANELGASIYPQRLTDWFRRERASAGLPSGHLHILRHTHITLGLSGDPTAQPPVPPVPLHIMAARVGDKPETLLQTYAHLLPQSDEQAAQAFASLLVDSRLTNEVVSAV